MKVLTVFALLLSSLLFIFPQTILATGHSYNGKPAVKMLTFNVGGQQGGDDTASQVRRWNQLATFVKNNNIDVVLLQELSLHNYPNDANTLILKAFTEVGYPMHGVHFEPNGEANAILSKYPFVPNSYSFWELSKEKRRYPISVGIQTPYGQIRVVNIHTHFEYSCDHAARFFEAYVDPNNPQFSPAGESIIMGGDYNVYFDKFEPVSSRNCQGTPQEEKRLQAVIPQTRLACEDVQNCSNTANRYLDLFFSLKSSSALIYQTWVDGGISHLGNGHPPIVGLIGSSTWNNNSPLKVISFNIGAFTIEKHFLDSRIEPIARYLAKGKYDVIALQETHYGRKEGERIASKLEEIGAGKFYVAKAADPKSDTDVERPGPGVYLLSKYPFDSINAEFNKSTVTRSLFATITTPYGSMNLITAHPSSGGNCEDSVNFLNDLNKLSDTVKKNLLILGDVNATIPNIDETPQSLKSVTGFPCRQAVNMTQNQHNCDDTNKCDRPNVTIDWIFTRTPSEFKIKTKSLLKNMAQEIGIPGSGWQDDLHIPITAEIYSINPHVKQGDLDSDRDVDIYDYNIFLGKFGATGAPGFHPADIIQNGIVDIFDYNKLIENFGK